MSGVWGVGCYDDGARRVAWPVSTDEMDRDLGAGARRIGALGIGAGDRVLICSMLSEAAQHWPLIVGVMLSGAQLSCADSTAAEATRVAMFLRRLPYDAVLGVGPALLDGLEALGHDPAAVFASVRVVGAHPGASDRLRALGVPVHDVALCGPALAIAPTPGAPAAVDTDEWTLDAHDGRIVVSSLRPRAHPFVRTPTAIRGAVVDGGVVPESPSRG
ncbi:MAG TPA: hypothetical protein VFZ83_04615 [Acidimicrobiia bacterium]|nr:hypothetical protein [Acidimicrobiia bacterium]